MAHKKKHGPAPVPPANQPQAGPPGAADADQLTSPGAGGGDPFQNQDPQRRLGNYESGGEHSRQQPGPLNDGTQHSR